MRKIKLLSVAIGILALLSGCTVPTRVTKSITEITGPDGKKTVSVTKTIEQSGQIATTKANQAVIDEFNR